MDSNFDRALNFAKICVDEYLEENQTEGISDRVLREICTFAGVIAGAHSDELDALYRKVEKLYQVFYVSDS